jgi:hypothetical protein
VKDKCSKRDLETLKYFQSPISTTAHAPKDIEIMERDDSSEHTNSNNSVENVKCPKIVTCG